MASTQTPSLTVKKETSPQTGQWLPIDKLVGSRGETGTWSSDYYPKDLLGRKALTARYEWGSQNSGPHALILLALHT